MKLDAADILPELTAAVPLIASATSDAIDA